ncbi:MAG TPA: MarC family protein [Gammaproteobacteria bacterium]|nr:MarC family protein [Gammaproteobacteria bacterium]
MTFDVLVNLFVVLFVVIDPIGLAPIFGALTRGGSAAYRRRMAVKAILLAAGILYLFAFSGDWLMRALGIGIPAFKIAGGLLLFLVAIDMVFARHSGLRSTTVREQEEARFKEDISVFPLAFPLLAGPGALTTVLLFVADTRGNYTAFGALLGVLAVVLLLAFLALMLAGHLMKLLGETGANVVDRLLGVILAALAVQFVLDGLSTALTGA